MALGGAGFPFAPGDRVTLSSHFIPDSQCGIRHPTSLSLRLKNLCFSCLLKVLRGLCSKREAHLL